MSTILKKWLPIAAGTIILTGVYTVVTQHPVVAAPGNPQVHSKGDRMANYVKPSDAELKKKLTPIQYEVTQHEGTEPPFRNEYWDNHAAGIYVDVVCGEPLFSSLDKFESGTGWPSFTQPLEPANVVDEDRPQVLHGPHRGPLEARRLAPRPRLRRRPGADRPALLHELRVAALHPRRQARSRGLRRVPARCSRRTRTK